MAFKSASKELKY